MTTDTNRAPDASPAADKAPAPDTSPTSDTSPVPDTIPTPDTSTTSNMSPPAMDTSSSSDTSFTSNMSPSAMDESSSSDTSFTSNMSPHTLDESSSSDTSFTLNTSSTLDASPALNPSFVLKEPRRGVIEDGSTPLIRSQTDVIIRIHSRAFSAPDVTLWRNGPKDINGKDHIPGLHAAGVITVVGSGCKTLKEGDRVIFSPLCPCRTCIFCKSGVYNLCPQSTVLGIPPVDGTLQKFCVVPGDFCVVLPDHLTFEQGAIVGSYAIAFHVCRQANIKPGNSVIIFGENSCANFCAAVAKTFGATMVVLVGTQNYPNIKPTDTAREIAKSVLKRYKLNTGSHVVIEASGLDIFMNTGIYVLRSSGTFVQIYSTAYGFDRPADFPVRQACMKALIFRGARGCLPEDFTTSIEMLASGELCMKEVKNVYEFEDAQAAFEKAQKKIENDNTARRMGDPSFFISGPREE